MLACLLFFDGSVNLGVLAFPGLESSASSNIVAVASEGVEINGDAGSQGDKGQEEEGGLRGKGCVSELDAQTKEERKKERRKKKEE